MFVDDQVPPGVPVMRDNRPEMERHSRRSLGPLVEVAVMIALVDVAFNFSTPLFLRRARGNYRAGLDKS